MENINEIPAGDNYIGMMINALNSDRKENEISLYCAIDIHGGITFSDNIAILCSKKEWLDEEPDNLDLWIFGFDTAHIGDNEKNWNKGACIDETLRFKTALENWK